MKRSLDVENRVGAEQNARRIHEKHVSAGVAGNHEAVDGRKLPPGDTAQNILDPRGTVKVRRVPGTHGELGEAVELVRAVNGAAIDVVEARQRLRHVGAERAVGSDGGDHLGMYAIRRSNGPKEHHGQRRTDFRPAG